ncbi:hypothetical protein Dsin_011809 [Dipteronia sinensis]|uniref:Uncharacterized protein n=1 Tax=Dipteronia sinensis TaxID=43782 RepID=A0AAE0E7K8_9ROSI|nr:hypothetical protein Dsin_011809 [Dipteronia sinensis]
MTACFVMEAISILFKANIDIVHVLLLLCNFLCFRQLCNVSSCFVHIYLDVLETLQELNRTAEVDKTCNFVKVDYRMCPQLNYRMKMMFADNTFDGIFAIEATCQAPNVVCHIMKYSIDL